VYGRAVRRQGAREPALQGQAPLPRARGAVCGTPLTFTFTPPYRHSETHSDGIILYQENSEAVLCIFMASLVNFML